jgi:hypothetical protein
MVVPEQWLTRTIGGLLMPHRHVTLGTGDERHQTFPIATARVLRQ